jgi:uncharacterized protein YecE (DUF72 family)
MKQKKTEIRVGCQGWNYADWVTKAGSEPVFYPHGTKSNEMLETYARVFETVEVDSTFYAIPSETTLENWYKRTPDEFTFSLKLPREITHEHLLQASSFDVLDEFCERILALKEKLASVLVQLPPQFDTGGANVRSLLEFLPRLPAKIKFAVEFRSRDWFKGDTLDVLAKHKTALCLSEGNWVPREMIFEAAGTQTADFAYVRFMGERDLARFDVVQRKMDAHLQIWHEHLAEIAVPKFVYFSNFYEGFAPASANKLKKLFGQETIEPEELENQPSLF